MTRFLRLELSRYRHTALFVALTAAGTLLAALYFFAVVGRFDDSPDSAMLRSYGAVVPLALTVALCVLVVYGAVIYARRIVADYIGNRRIALYSYPGGRDPLFQAKNIAYALVIGTASLIGYGAAVSVFLLTESFTPIVDGVHDGALWLTALLSTSCVVLLTVSVTAIAGAIGIWRRSTIATIVAAIILIALLGNAVAISLNGTPYLTWLVTGASLAIAVVMLSTQTRRIRFDEVL
ncbi:hypothetical protein MTQ12_14385 [Brevibacterium sp. R8603A2]|uniref:hypothetical protein n=1 Tax=Brevibacterium sp. R8603A2 TaxID=2929779 RepID=UPI001FF94F29|nr:hypothetical protein [Brevibacterium sp. R8603A2]MCK1804220.1 hypothetical protein [Brevibacterium sp. R8603A2]